MEGVKPVARRQLVDIHSSALMTTEDPVTRHGHAGDVGQSFRQGQLQGLVGWMPILGAPPQRTCIHLACRPGHYEIWEYCQSTSKVQASVLQNLRVQGHVASVRSTHASTLPASSEPRPALIELIG